MTPKSKTTLGANEKPVKEEILRAKSEVLRSEKERLDQERVRVNQAAARGDVGAREQLSTYTRDLNSYRELVAHLKKDVELHNTKFNSATVPPLSRSASTQPPAALVRREAATDAGSHPSSNLPDAKVDHGIPPGTYVHSFDPGDGKGARKWTLVLSANGNLKGNLQWGTRSYNVIGIWKFENGSVWVQWQGGDFRGTPKWHEQKDYGEWRRIGG